MIRYWFPAATSHLMQRPDLVHEGAGWWPPGKRCAPRRRAFSHCREAEPVAMRAIRPPDALGRHQFEDEVDVAAAVLPPALTP